MHETIFRPGEVALGKEALILLIPLALNHQFGLLFYLFILFLLLFVLLVYLFSLDGIFMVVVRENIAFTHHLVAFDFIFPMFEPFLHIDILNFVA